MTIENPVARRAAILIASTNGTPEEIAAALDAAGMLARPAVEVPGPYPLWVHPTGLGVAIDAHPIFAALIRALAAEGPEELAEELQAIAEASGPAQDALIEVLSDRLGGTQARYGATATLHLAETLLSIVRPGFPHQRKAA
jgi:hypothetical protein